MKATVDWRDPDYSAVYEERITRLRKIREGEQELLDAVWRFYADNPVEWVEDWCFTYDPRPKRGKPHIMPFLLFPRQRELVKWLQAKYETREPGVLEKSRDTGISWVAAAFGVWAWTFHDAKVTYGSYDEAHVDVLGNMDSILEKVRMILRNLPPEMRPPGFDPEEHMMHKRIVKPGSPSTITGEVGKNIGRGGRSTLYFVDEYAHLEHPDQADASLTATAECKIYASTPYGLGSFYQKCTGGIFDVFRYHWSDDPRKNAEWAAKKKHELSTTPELWAQEYELDHAASVANVAVPAEWVRASRQLLGVMRRLGLKHKRPEDFPPVAGMDVGGDGDGNSVFQVRRGPYALKPVVWPEGDTTNTARKAVGLCKRYQASVLNFDANGVGAGVASTLRHSADLFLPPPETPPAHIEQRGGIEDEINEAARELRAELPIVAEVLVGERIVARGIMTGEAASDVVKWPDGKTSQQKFMNLRAELWWTARTRLQAAHEMMLYLEGDPKGAMHPFDDLLLLPAEGEEVEKLATELSSLTYYRTPSGKIAIESKKEARSRGVKSPDRADALVMTLIPPKKGVEVGRLTGWS